VLIVAETLSSHLKSKNSTTQKGSPNPKDVLIAESLAEEKGLTEDQDLAAAVATTNPDTL
jgi:hypothetical protein